VAHTWLDTYLADSFCQVAGIFVNCMTDTPKTEIAISNKIEQWIRSPRFCPGDSRPEIWDVLALHRRPSDKEWMSDVFIFDPRNGSLVEIILGIGYQRVSRAVLGKMLARLTRDGEGVPTSPIASSTPSAAEPIPASHKDFSKDAIMNNDFTQSDISSKMLELLSSIAGVERDEIHPDTLLTDIGINSLVSMELAREIRVIFKISLDSSELMRVDDFASLIKAIERALGVEGEASQLAVGALQEGLLPDSKRDADGYTTISMDDSYSSGSESMPMKIVRQSGLLTPPEELLKLE